MVWGVAGSGKAPDVVALMVFAAVVVLGGSNVLAVRFSNMGLPPMWGAGVRFGLGATLFILLALTLRARVPRGREFGLTAVYGVLIFGAAFGFGYWALQFVTAGTATVVMATIPLVTLLLAAAQGFERIRGRSLVGAGLAFSGVAFLVLTAGAIEVPLLPVLAILLGTVCLGQGIILGKRISHNHPVGINAVAMSAGAVLLLFLSAMVGEPWIWPTRSEALFAVIYLVLFGSVALFVLSVLLVRRWSPSATSYAMVLFPLVTSVLEWWLSGVPITGSFVVAAVLVMSGVWFGALAPSKAEPESDPVAGGRPAPAAERGSEERAFPVPAERPGD
jgi:drug/metabolite transporter (DMT)-like permease